MRIEGQEFIDQDVEIDGKKFVNCRFIGKSILIYRGGPVPDFPGCEMDPTVQIAYHDAAKRTIELLVYLAGSGAQDMVSGLIEMLMRASGLYDRLQEQIGEIVRQRLAAAKEDPSP